LGLTIASPALQATRVAATYPRQQILGECGLGRQHRFGLGVRSKPDQGMG
jgi:hypothetical protein